MTNRPLARAMSIWAALCLVQVSALGVVARDPAVDGNGHQTGFRMAPTRAEKSQPSYRGRIRVDDIVSGEKSNGKPVDSPKANRDPRPVAAPISITAAPAVDFATTNATPPAAQHAIGGLQGVNFANHSAPFVAAGPDDVMQTAGTSFRITSRSGGDQRVVTHRAFFRTPDFITKEESQRVYFDSTHNRWVALEVSLDCTPNGGAAYGHGYLDLAISDTADPRSSWQLWFWSFIDELPADPGFGTATDKFVLTNNLHRMHSADCSVNDDTDGWHVRAIEWANYLQDHSFQSDLYVVDRQPSRVVLRILPAVQSPAESGDVHMAAETYDPASPAAKHVWHMVVTGHIFSSALIGDDLSAANIVPPWSGPGSVGGASMGFGPSSITWQNGRLVIASGEFCTPPTDTISRSCVRITELNTSTKPASRVQDFNLSQAGANYFAPGVILAPTGDLYITYDRSVGSPNGPPIQPSGYVVRQAPGDPHGTVSLPTKFVTGASAYSGTDWADVVGLSADPQVNDSVWITGAATNATHGWKSQVAQLTTATGDTYHPLDPLRVLDTRDGTGLSGTFVTGVPRTFPVAGASGGKIPSNAVAITANVTVTGQGSRGFVSVGPVVGPSPSSSTINFPAGDTRANNLTLPLNAQGNLMAVFQGNAGTSTQLVLDVTGWFTADSTGATYQPLTSARILDTRSGTGLSGRFVANSPRTLKVTGHGGVPAGARAITANLTVVGQTHGGYVSLTPLPTATPKTSTINFPAGDVRANGVTVPLAPDGTLSAVFKATTTGTTDLVLDVTGYYVAGTAGLRFYPLSPGRIMDTRTTALTQLSGPFSSSVPRTLVTGGHFGIPDAAAAATGNLTVVGQTKGGYVSITKDATATPNVSTINFPPGDIRANGVTVPLNAANDLALVYKSSSAAKTHLLLDVSGYFR
jgi:hypothetical protein